MAKDKEQPIFQALGVDDFGSTRPDDFDGAIKGARYIAFKWPNSQYGHALYAEITFLPDPDSGFEEFSEVYKVGSLKFNFPSLDGKTLAGPEDISIEDYETLADDPEAEIEEGMEELYKGPFVVTVAKSGADRKLPNSHWSQFMKAVKDLYPPDDPEADPDGTSFPTQLNIDAMLAGYRFHFLRVDEDSTKRKKKDNGKGPFQIHVPTDALGKDDSLAADDSAASKKSSKAKPAPAAAKKSKPKPEPEEEEDEDTDSDLEDLEDTDTEDSAEDTEDEDESDESRYIGMIKTILAGAKKGEGMTTQAIIARFVGTAKTPSDKSAGMKLIQTPKWMQAADKPWKLKEGKYYPK